MSGDDTDPRMTRGWTTVNSDSSVQILLHLGCQTGISDCMCQTPSSIQVFALSCSHGDSSPISESSNTMLPGPQQASLWCLSFCHIAYPIHQKILSSRYNQIPPLLLTSTITTLVQTIIISYLSSYCSLLTGLSTSNFTHHSLCFHTAA